MIREFSKSIFLTGLPGVGKSTLGKKWAQYLNLPFFDLDEEIEKKEDSTIHTIFERKGEEYFRVLESQVLSDLLLSSKSQMIALGGGALQDMNKIDLLKLSGILVYIEDDMKSISSRIKSDIEAGKERPMFKHQQRISEILKSLWLKRRSLYEQSQVITRAEAFNHLHLLTNQAHLFTLE